MSDILGAAPQPPELPGTPQEQVIARDEPEGITDARKALVSQWLMKIKGAEAHWKPDFKRMRENMEKAKLGASGEWVKGGNYTTNILQRHINQKVASLYAKNPRAVARRRKRLEFKVWDGNMTSLQAAQQAIQIDPNSPEAMALIQDVMSGLQRRKMLDKIGSTVEILFHYFLDESSQRFKRGAKQTVRRTLVTGISYLELGFQRLLEKRPEVTAQIEDYSGRLATLQALTADVADSELQEADADMENLRLLLKQAQEAEEIVVREGPVFDWPKSTEIIIDPDTVQIEGWIGTNWIARKLRLTATQIKETYQVDIKKGSNSVATETETAGKQAVNTQDGNSSNQDATGARAGKILVYKIWDKRTGHEFILAEGWPDFLKEPAAPDVTTEQFFPVYPLQFNPVEDDQETAKDTRVFGLSEIELLEDAQEEYNRARQGLREHRWANRPGYVTSRGSMEDEDREALAAHPVNAVVEIALLPSQKVEDVLQPVPKIPIDPAVYDVSPAFEDIQRAGGSQEANLGGTKGDTATEASIAEGSRVTATQSNVDDLDDFLTDIARATGQLMMLTMSREQVASIVGPGSVWPEFSAQQVAEQLFLEVKAGSSGRPNRQLEIANFERMAPLLLQIPGIQPEFLARKALERLDETMELEDAYLDGLPSIIAMNSLQGAAGAQGGAPGTPAKKGAGTAKDPAAQGGQGAQNAPDPQTVQPGPQPGFPSP